MTGKSTAVVPKLRFPGFSRAGNWHCQPLGKIAETISEKVGAIPCVPMSVTSGVGLVSQEEKFGRIIAGDSYKNYIRLQSNDFAYNKSATKEYPQGYIARYGGTCDAAVPNSIFSCFRADAAAVIPDYLDHLFQGNHHGRWLRRYITVGARAHGALSVSDDALMSMPVPLPPVAVSRLEQRKIADCLGSLDDLISAERRKLEALREHNQGLMQQLFPQPGETVPRLRFPEFTGAPEWATLPFQRLYHFKPTNVYSRDQLNYDIGSVRNIHYGDIHTRYSAHFRLHNELVPFVTALEFPEKIRPESFCQERDMVFADASEDVADVGKSIELVDLADERVVSGSHTILARPCGSTLVRGFGAYVFKSRVLREQIEKEAHGTKVMSISPSRLARVTVPFPSDHEEQRRIVGCLFELDLHIEAQSDKLESLQAHKRGLLQQLFPSLEDATL